jgi:hypothetical protein
MESSWVNKKQAGLNEIVRFFFVIPGKFGVYLNYKTNPGQIWTCSWSKIDFYVLVSNGFRL